MSATTSRPTLASLLSDDLIVGEPDVAGPLALFPIHARPDAREYLSFVEASADGCTVHELEPASVNDVVVDNPLDVPVLLFEGEDIQGARQDRTVDLTVLVPARMRLPIAVSCVEAGR